MAAAGVPPKPEWKLDGVNLLPFLEGKTTAAPHEALYWRFGEQMAIRMGDCIARIQGLLAAQERVPFSALVRSAASRLEIIVTLQAVLEMIKQGTIQVRQECLFGEIVIERPPAEAAAADAVPAPSMPA